MKTLIEVAVSLNNGITRFNICKQGSASFILPFRPDHESIDSWSEPRTDIQFSGIYYDFETTRKNL